MRKCFIAGLTIVAACAAQSEPGRASWGAHAVNLTTGAVVFSHDASSYFSPASNAKLYTTALALKRLGPDYRFVTKLMATVPPDSQGVLRGDLVFVGGGDPNLSGRVLPFKEGAPAGDPLGPLKELVNQLAQSGVKRITGDIVGDDTFLRHDPYPVGWQVDDSLIENGAAVSALTLHDNVIRMEVRAGAQAGDPAVLKLIPPSGYFAVTNDVITSANGGSAVSLERTAGSRQIRIKGTIPKGNGAAVLYTSLDDPAHYAAFALRDALTSQGIQVDGGVRVRHRYEAAQEESPAKVELVQHFSLPSIEGLRAMVKVSQNLHAELFRRAAEGDNGELKKFVMEAGIDPADVGLRDGSGLSRMSLVSPEATVKLLVYMAASPEAEQWISLLPVGGEDGTLNSRFKGLSQIKVMAKTGTMTHIGALSGYLDNVRGERIAFSVMVNNSGANSAAVREFIDRIVVSLGQ